MTEVSFHPKDLHPFEGLQFFNKKEAENAMKYIKKKERKNFCVVKEVKPDWYNSQEWKPLVSIQKKSKMKVLGRKCL